MATYRMKFMFDWGSGVCLWSTNQAAMTKFNGYPILTANLPVSDKTKNELEHLIELHDKALNWNEPNSDLLWNDNQIDEFLQAVQRAYNSLCKELGPDYDIKLIEGM